MALDMFVYLSGLRRKLPNQTIKNESHYETRYATSQVKSGVLSMALNSVISVTNQTGILSGVTTGTLKPLSEVERSFSRVYLITA